MSDNFLASILAIAEEQARLFAAAKCGGELARLGECSDEWAAQCDLRANPSCPRNIREYDIARERQALEERLTDSGVPRPLVNIVLGAMKPTEATRAVDEWIVSGRSMLLLTGGVGVGKSVAGAYTIRRTPGKWVGASDISRLASLECAPMLLGARRARLLVVDDLGAEYADKSNWARTAMRNLLCERHDAGLRSVVTTNLSATAWKSYADDRLIDRLATGTVKVIGGESMRRK